jgi:protein-S-isoprenylcysteine O-methyltransferase Ste14
MESLADAAFAGRGPLLIVPAVFALVASEPTSETLLAGLGLSLFALSLRGWAFAHLGGAGRTRDLAAPTERVNSGPYRWVAHPVYVANCGLAGAMLVAAAPGWIIGAGLGAFVFAFYGLLAWREGAQLRDVPAAPGLIAWRRVPRWERSTWATTALFFGLLAARW